MTIPLGTRRYILTEMLDGESGPAMERMLAARFKGAANARMTFDDPYSQAVLREYMRAIQSANEALRRRVDRASAAELNRLLRLLIGGAAGPGGSLRRVDWDIVNRFAAQTYPRYMAGRRIASTLTRQMLSPHTAVGRKRLRRNFDRANRNAVAGSKRQRGNSA